MEAVDTVGNGCDGQLSMQVSGIGTVTTSVTMAHVVEAAEKAVGK